MIRRALALLLLLAAPAWADAPVARLTGPRSVEPGGMILLSPAGTESDEPPIVVPEEGQPAALTVTPLYTPDGMGGFTPFAALSVAPGVPGSYRFVCIAVGDVDGIARYSVASFAVTVGAPKPPAPDPGPDPDPEPDPDPKPVPEPISGPLHVTYIVGPDMTPLHAALRVDPSIRWAMGELDAYWHTYSSDEEDVARLGYGGIVRSRGLSYPALLIQDQNGVLVDARTVATADEVIAAVESLREGE